MAINAGALASALMGTQERRSAPRASRDQYGTIALDALGNPTVMLDGGEEHAPCTCMVGVHHGDRVMCHIVNHRIVVFANITVPSVNDDGYQHVKDIAEEANGLLDGVAEAAAAAEKTVAEIIADADSASGLVSGMQSAAETAGTTLAQIVADADSAASTLEGMRRAAESADTTLEGIYGDAAEARSSARAASAAAGDALVQVATVQDVIGAVNWIAEHGEYRPTSDSAVDGSKVYYERSGSGTDSDPFLYHAVADPDDSEIGSYYELRVDQAISQYVASHLALTDAGLYVLKDENGYKLLCADSGVSVIDPDGHVVTTYGESITFDGSRRQYIGNEDAYILFEPERVEGGETIPASITIGGGNVLIGGSKKLSELMADVEQASSDAATALDSASLYITSTNGNLFKNGTESTVLQVAVFPNGGGRLDTIADVRARFGAGAYIEWRWRHDAEGTWGTLATSDPHLSNGGMWLTVTPVDVESKTSFEASLVVP